MAPFPRGTSSRGFPPSLLRPRGLTSAKKSVLWRRGLSSLPSVPHQVVPSAFGDEAPKQASNIDTEEMFGENLDKAEWLRLTINDEWARSPDDAPDPSKEPGDLNLARYRGMVDEKELPTGKGKLFAQDNRQGVTIYYVGEFKSGKFHGQGRHVRIEHNALTKKQKDQLPKNVHQWTGKEKLLALGVLYEGAWEEGKMHGQGRLSNPYEQSVYEGDFHRGRRTGQGKMVSDNGEHLYVGQFEDGCVLLFNDCGCNAHGVFVRVPGPGMEGERSDPRKATS